VRGIARKFVARKFVACANCKAGNGWVKVRVLMIIIALLRALSELGADAV
jgi:hypothetical protein